MYCSSCGKEIVDDSRFCPKCGSALNETPDEEGSEIEDEVRAIRKHTKWGQAQKPKTSRDKVFIGCGVLLTIFGLLTLAIGTCLGGGSSTPSTPSYSGPVVVYEITGTAEKVNITLSNDTGGTEQSYTYLNPTKTLSTPWRREYYSFPNRFLYISAQNQGEYGTVTVSIYVNGELFKTSSSSGAYVIASASGSK